MSKAGIFLAGEGLDGQSTDSALFIECFKMEMQKKLDGEKSSLAMIPTYLSCSGAIEENDCAIAVDVGGTNFRTGLVYADAAGARLECFSSIPTPGTHGEVTWDDFISAMADSIRPLTAYTKKIGICISFPTTITPERDGIIQRTTKEVAIKGYEGKYLCRDLLRVLNVPQANAIVLNDTTAVLLSGRIRGADSEGLVGFILGTGTNICCQLDCERLGIEQDGKMIVAVESGGFVPPQRTQTDIELDMATSSPGVYLEEKMVSGAYLGELCRLTLIKAAGHGVFCQETAERLSRMKSLTTPEADAFALGEGRAEFVSTEDAESGRELVCAVFDRAAKHIACTLRAVYEFADMRGQCMTIAVDGSVFKRSVMFAQAFQKYEEILMPDRIKGMLSEEEATAIGTAVGAMLCCM